MKNGKKMMALLLALCMVCALAACGGGDAESSKQPSAPSSTDTSQTVPSATVTPAAPSAAGYYKLESMIEDGEDAWAEMAELGIMYYLVLEDGGTCYMDVFGERQEMKWDEAYLYSVEGGEVSEGSPYTYANGTITLSDEGTTMTFVRLTEEEKASYLENGSGSIGDVLTGAGSSADIPNGEPTVGELSGTIGDHSVTVLGAEAITDDDGAPAIRFWYDFTNGSGEDASPLWEVFFTAVQDDGELDGAYAYDSGVAEDMNCFEEIAPGETIRCTEIHSFDPNGGIVALRLSDLLDSSEMIYYADPQNLSGAPAN